jgi:uncharacterized protein
MEVTLKKSRPVLGAYVLYPGWFDQLPENNPYKESIEKVGIGAFALLPGQENKWLYSFLKEKLGAGNASTGYQQAGSDIHFVEDAARIAYQGMAARHYPDLTLVATAAPQAGRTQAYLDAFKYGTAKWYHMRLHASERVTIEQNAIREVRFCAIAVTQENGSDRHISFVYR